jgi:hypothetical protein
MPAKYVAYSEEREVRLLTDDEKDAIEKKKKALDGLLSQQKAAKYKIDLNLGRGFSTKKPSHGALTFWESGKRFHGGGDCKLYICPGKMREVNECEAFIPEPSQAAGFLFCPECNNVWKGDDVIGEVLARLMPNGWATAMLRYFIQLKYDADLRIKYIIDVGRTADIRAAAELEQEKQKGGEVLDIPRQKNTRIYLVSDIIKDTAAGADLHKRILAFIAA